MAGSGRCTENELALGCEAGGGWGESPVAPKRPTTTVILLFGDPQGREGQAVFVITTAGVGDTLLEVFAGCLG